MAYNSNRRTNRPSLQPIMDPQGDVLDATELRSTRLTDQGVLCLFGAHQRLLRAYKGYSSKDIELIRDEFNKVILALAQGKSHTPQWQGEQAPNKADSSVARKPPAGANAA